MTDTFRCIKMKIVSFKGIELVEWSPGDGVNVVCGENAQGKTSLLDALYVALRGGEAMPSRPVKLGAEKAEISLDFGDFNVTRVLRTDGSTSKLVVKDNKGRSIDSPQAFLNAMTGAGLTMEPLKFLAMPAKDQANVLLKLVGIDLQVAAAEEELLRTKRTAVGNVGKALKSVVDAMPPEPEDMNLWDTDELQAQIDGVFDVLNEIDAKKREAKSFRNEAEDIASRKAGVASSTEKLVAEIVALNERIAAAQREIVANDDHMRDLEALYLDRSDRAKVCEEEAAGMVAPDVKELQARKDAAHEHNRLVRQSLQNKETRERHKEKQDEYAKLTQEITDHKEAAERKLREAKYPVEGLGVNDSGVNINNVPLAQLSHTQQVLVAYHIAAKTCGKVGMVLVRDASLLSDKSRELLYNAAKADGMQLFVELVGESSEENAIEIVEGRAKE